MNDDHVRIMDIPFLNITKVELLSNYIYPSLENKDKKFIVTANPEIVMQAKENKAFKEIIRDADYVLPDGAGIVIASKIMKQPIKERLPGFELMEQLISYAENKGFTCYFFGAKDTVNEKLIKNLKTQFPSLKIAGHHHGYVDIYDSQVANEISNFKPDIVFVALGSPKQEMWIAHHYEKFDQGLFMGVGGSFDVLAGEVKRAPNIWIKLNLEWLYRLMKQPFRWKRILKAMEFMLRILVRRY